MGPVRCQALVGPAGYAHEALPGPRPGAQDAPAVRAAQQTGAQHLLGRGGIDHPEHDHSPVASGQSRRGETRPGSGELVLQPARTITQLARARSRRMAGTGLGSVSMILADPPKPATEPSPHDHGAAEHPDHHHQQAHRHAE